MDNPPNIPHRPILAKGVRLRWDKVREEHQLIFPEGMLSLNATGAAIVKLCDGRTGSEIVSTLGETYDKADLQDDVSDFLSRLTHRGLLRDDTSE